MDSRRQGEELSHLARHLFDVAAQKWYWALGLEIASGAVAIAMTGFRLPADLKIVGAFSVVVMTVVAYSLRITFEDQYAIAETMRRQSVLSEALGWKISSAQLAAWRTRAGQKVRKKAETSQRESNYYASKEESGAKRLAEMTTESVFYTHNLYEKLRLVLWRVFVISTFALMVAVPLALTRTTPQATDYLVAEAVYSFILIVLSADLLGWCLKLNQLIPSLRSIEQNLEGLLAQTPPPLPEILREVSEYNCEVVQGFPIHNWLFKRWHPEICRLWNQRAG